MAKILIVNNKEYQSLQVYRALLNISQQRLLSISGALIVSLFLIFVGLFVHSTTLLIFTNLFIVCNIGILLIIRRLRTFPVECRFWKTASSRIKAVNSVHRTLPALFFFEVPLGTAVYLKYEGVANFPAISSAFYIAASGAAFAFLYLAFKACIACKDLEAVPDIRFRLVPDWVIVLALMLVLAWERCFRKDEEEDWHYESN